MQDIASLFADTTKEEDEVVDDEDPEVSDETPFRKTNQATDATTWDETKETEWLKKKIGKKISKTFKNY